MLTMALQAKGCVIYVHAVGAGVVLYVACRNLARVFS